MGFEPPEILTSTDLQLEPGLQCYLLENILYFPGRVLFVSQFIYQILSGLTHNISIVYNIRVDDPK